MKRVGLGIAVLLTAQVAFATAIRYEFRQSTTSDVENTPSTDCSGRGVIDGTRSRVEFLTGNAYAPGTYVITTNGSRNMIFVDPHKKAYVDVNAAGVSAALGTTTITISNKKVDMTEMPDHPTIAGIPTDHYRLSISYDITLLMGTLPMTQSVRTLIDKWVTTAFGDVGGDYLAAGAMKTGNADLDELVNLENTKIKGFALKQTSQITTTANRHSIAGSDLGRVFRPMRTQTREIEVTSVQAVGRALATEFMVPAGFHRADPLHDDTEKAPLNVLSMEPPPGE
jgi:hypothetical protein